MNSDVSLSGLMLFITGSEINICRMNEERKKGAYSVALTSNANVLPITVWLADDDGVCKTSLSRTLKIRRRVV